MNKKLNNEAGIPIVPLKELNLSARFLFDEVMEDPRTQQDVLSIIFDREVPLVKYGVTEKEIRLTPLARSIRMDLFSIDEDQIVYNTEMQDRRRTDLVKRSRYYQALMDTSLLEPGVPDYNGLNQTYLITIMTFDFFGYQKYRYTFVPKCREVGDCELEDGAVRIFLNTKGKNDDEVPKELADFLHYVEKSTDEEAARTNSERIRRIHERVRRVRLSEEVGVKYLRILEEKNEEREESAEEINHLNEMLIKAGRMDDLLRCATDREYQKQLLKEYENEEQVEAKN